MQHWHRAYDYQIEEGKSDEEAKLFASEQRAKAAACYDADGTQGDVW